MFAKLALLVVAVILIAVVTYLLWKSRKSNNKDHRAVVVSGGELPDEDGIMELNVHMNKNEYFDLKGIYGRFKVTHLGKGTKTNLSPSFGDVVEFTSFEDFDETSQSTTLRYAIKRGSYQTAGAKLKIRFVK